jgi:hypothetical protein
MEYDDLNRLERLMYEVPKTYVPDDAFGQYPVDMKHVLSKNYLL